MALLQLRGQQVVFVLVQVSVLQELLAHLHQALKYLEE
jgi:hypothetical protein